MSMHKQMDSTLEATSTRQHELAAMIIHRGIGA